MRICRQLEKTKNGCCETIQISNQGIQNLRFTAVDLGYLFPLQNQTLYAIPFTVQQDGMRHIYSSDILKNGHYRALINDDLPDPNEKVYGNSVYSDNSHPEPPLWEEDRLRSEAWFWGGDDGGLLVAKYNNQNIEYSIAEPMGEKHEFLRLGGVGFCLFGEPADAVDLPVRETFTYGKTFYIPCESFEKAAAAYRQLLDDHGHGFPEDYRPKIHWNELYDIGWFHSNRSLLKENYTLSKLLQEAQKAKECGCDALYLDPGWEYAEGLTFFDHHRLGQQKDFVKILKEQYGLDLSIRCILRTYINYWPSHLDVLHREGGIQAACMVPTGTIPNEQLLYEQCLCNPVFLEEKARRIGKLVEDGATWIMLDEMDWRGPCYEKAHGHKVPSTAAEHADAVYDLAKRVKTKYQIPVEVHDPVWPWHSSVYTPVYYRQGFGAEGSYSENWGFEFMWECIHDLQSGKALSLYYYNLGCNIPLYLHINMAADNDQCLFFWWAASTVRHLGIGGKECHSSVIPTNRHFEVNFEKRYASYKECMEKYCKLRAYYQRGIFCGIHEYAHLHVLKEAKGGVLDLFNCTDATKVCTAEIDAELLGGEGLQVVGANVVWENGILRVIQEIPAFSHALVRIGDAAEIVL